MIQTDYASMEHRSEEKEEPMQPKASQRCLAGCKEGMFCLCIPKRYIIIVLICIGMMSIHAMRVNIAVTVITILDQAPHTKVGSVEAIANLPQLDWDSRMIGFLHSSFYIGYLLTLMPGGYISNRVPAHRLFGGSILFSCVLNLLLPVTMGEGAYTLTIMVRIIQGLSEGLVYPSCYALLRHWSTPHEKSRMGSVVLTGVYTGAILVYPLSGYITHYSGWQYVYYLFGGIGIIWFMIWLFVSYEKPSEHPGITTAELKMIAESQGTTALQYQDEKVPWFQIFTSLPVWSLCVCNFARSWIFFMLLTQEPAYLNVFDYSVAENGVLSSVPHILMAIMAVLSGFIADSLMRDPLLTATQVRKLLTCIGFGVEAVCLFMLKFIAFGDVALIFLTIGVGMSGLTIAGWNINHLDLAPRYASVLISISTAFGTIGGILSPVVAGYLTMGQGIKEWQDVFMISSFIIMAAAIFYFIFGSGLKQSWAEPAEKILLVNRSSPIKGKMYTEVQQQQASYRATDNNTVITAGNGIISPTEVQTGTEEAKDVVTNPVQSTDTVKKPEHIKES